MNKKGVYFSPSANMAILESVTRRPCLLVLNFPIQVFSSTDRKFTGKIPLRKEFPLFFRGHLGDGNHGTRSSSSELVEIEAFVERRRINVKRYDAPPIPCQIELLGQLMNPQILPPLCSSEASAHHSTTSQHAEPAKCATRCSRVGGLTEAIFGSAYTAPCQ